MAIFFCRTVNDVVIGFPLGISSLSYLIVRALVALIKKYDC